MGSALNKPVLVQSLERHNNEFFRAGCATVNGLRSNNEDAHLLLHGQSGKDGFFAVFDGHSGPEAAIAARNCFREQLSAPNFHLEKILSASSSASSQQAEELISRLAYSVDQKVLEICGEDSTSGTTGTFVFAHTGSNQFTDLVVGNVGDSRVLLWTGSEMRVMTTDHKPDVPEEKARIEKFGGKVERGRVEGNLAVSRGFGDLFFKTNRSRDAGVWDQKVIAKPDVTTASVPFGQGAFAVLCCDGVFEGDFSNEYVVEFIRSRLMNATAHDVAAVAGMVCVEAVRRGSKDNVTCMIVAFDNGCNARSSEPNFDALPGPFSQPRHALFRKLFEESARAGHRRVEEVLEMRYDQLVTRFLESKKRSRANGNEASKGSTENGLTHDEKVELQQGFRIRHYLRYAQKTAVDEHGQPVEVEHFTDDGDSADPPIDKGEARTEWFRNLFTFLSTLRNDDDEQDSRKKAAALPAPQAAEKKVSAQAQSGGPSIDSVTLSHEKQQSLSYFMDLAPGVPPDTALKLLLDAQWDLWAALDAVQK